MGDHDRRIQELEAELREWKEAARSAAATAERAIGRLQRAEPLIKAAIRWADLPPSHRTEVELIEAIDNYLAGEPS